MNKSKRFFIGKPLSNEAASEQRLRKIKALPILASDALSSVTYGTEEILNVLMLAGTAALSFVMPVALSICMLLAILGISYYQTIAAYPKGGGAFAVAKDNLGKLPALLAATALLIDYLLTVAVSVAAGVVAITSAFPALIPETVPLCILIIIFIAWMNLRGTRESATIFAYPTYAFIFTVLFMIALGVWHHYQHPNFHLTYTAAPSSSTFATLSLYLVLRAFSGGCSALTGVECIANSVPVFHKPEVRNARRTLLVMVGLLGLMFFGISYLANIWHVQPQDSQSILSQLGRTVFGNNSFLYYFLQAATAGILLLAANTAFTGFPRLASILSEDGYLPKQFSSLGDRLCFSNGIILLAVCSCILIILFHGNPYHLIPLYSVGVFLAFSLSQLGMVKFWFRKKRKYWIAKACINSLGFLATLTALIVIIDTKFIEGAWITAIMIVSIPLILRAIKKHYEQADRELSVSKVEAKQYLQHISHIKQKVVVPVSRIHRGTLSAICFAKQISDDVTAVNIAVNPEASEELKKAWDELKIGIPLVIIPSPYRETLRLLKNFIIQQDQREPERGLCTLVMPEAIPTDWWHYLLHNQRTTLLKAAILLGKRRKKGGTRIIVDVPYQLH